MVRNIKNICKPTTILLIIGFSISLTAVLVGISSINTILSVMNETGSDLPIVQTMQNTGLNLSISIYCFSILNSFVVTNYWMITKRRNFAIQKAFGWTNKQLIGQICQNMSAILLISLVISSSLLFLTTYIENDLMTVKLSHAFVVETVLLILVTLVFSMIVPIKRIITIEPAEVI